MVRKKNRFTILKYSPALVSGCLLTLSFPKTGLSALAFVALVPLLVSIRKMTLKESFFSGLTAGIIHFSTLIYWIIPTLTVYGGLHPALAALALGMLCGYLALYPAIFTVLYKKADFHPVLSPLMAACLWTGLEYIRTYALTGFSWGALGYSQYSNLSLIQMADFSGVYGVSFILVLVNASIAQIRTAWEKKQRIISLLSLFYTLVLVLGVLFYGSQKIRIIDDRIKESSHPVIGIVQGNIMQDIKWNAEFAARTIEKYDRLTRAAASQNPDLIVWPETALPFYYGLDTPLTAHVNQIIRSSHTSFLVGSPAFERQDKRILYYNRAYMFNPDGTVNGKYDKHHLVMFGEYVPFKKHLQFLGKITAQAGDFSPGSSPFIPLEFNEHKTGVLVCFEILFPKIASRFVKNGATFLTTITNDAWFGFTSAARQHFTISIFRAVENRRALIRASNTGISGFIDPAGRILRETALFTDQSVVQALPALTGTSFYTRYGDVFVWSAMVAFFLCFVVKRFNKPSFYKPSREK